MAQYFFRGRLWEYSGSGSWYFVTLPKKISIEIRKKYGHAEEGWGRLKTVARVGKTQWDTAVWYASKQSRYLLAIKADIRKKETLSEGDMVKAELQFKSVSGKSAVRKRTKKIQWKV